MEECEGVGCEEFEVVEKYWNRGCCVGSGGGGVTSKH